MSHDISYQTMTTPLIKPVKSMDYRLNLNNDRPYSSQSLDNTSNIKEKELRLLQKLNDVNLGKKIIIEEDLISYDISHDDSPSLHEKNEKNEKNEIYEVKSLQNTCSELILQVRLLNYQIDNQQAKISLLSSDLKLSLNRNHQLQNNINKLEEKLHVMNIENVTNDTSLKSLQSQYQDLLSMKHKLDDDLRAKCNEISSFEQEISNFKNNFAAVNLNTNQQNDKVKLEYETTLSNQQILYENKINELMSTIQSLQDNESHLRRQVDMNKSVDVDSTSLIQQLTKDLKEKELKIEKLEKSNVELRAKSAATVIQKVKEQNKVLSRWKL